MPRYNPLGFFAMFAIGALASGFQVRWSGYRNWLFDLVAIVAICWGLQRIGVQLDSRDGQSWGWLGIPYGFPWFVLAVGLFLAASPSSVLVGRLLDNPPARYIARISFGIYIWHYPVLELVRIRLDPLIDHGSSPEPLRFLTTSLIVTAISIVAAHLSWVLLEEPVIRWARRRERRRPTQGSELPAAVS